MKALFAALKARWRRGRKPREVLVRRTLHGPQRRKWGWEGGGPHRLPLTPPLPVAAVQLGALWKSPSSQTPPVLPGISSARPRPRGPETQQLRAQRQLRRPQSGPGGPPPGRRARHPWAGSAQRHLGALKDATCPGRHRPAESEPASSRVPWRLQHEDEHFGAVSSASASLVRTLTLQLHVWSSS